MGKNESQSHGELKSYFAYGSNLSSAQMRDRVGEWKTARRAFLRGWKLVFNVKSPRWKGGAANIVKSNQSETVYGVIYRITKAQLDTMTAYEKVSPQTIEVESEGRKIKAEVYIFNKSKPELEPASEYLDKVVEGLRNHGYGNGVVNSIIRKGKTNKPFMPP